jgi:ABC-type branched-subunit amino acid transport system substrate-binding protein
MNRSIARLAVAASAAALLTAACSSGSSSSTASSSVAGTSSSGTGTASGTPILIGGAGPLNNPAYNEPTLPLGLQAAVDSVNAAGGVNGHPLKLDFCNTDYTVNGELACAHQFVSEHVAAAVDPYFLADQSGAEVELLQKAGIPVFGGQGLSPVELNNPDAYPLSSGLPGWTYGAVASLLKSGAKKISILVDTNPGSQFAATLLQAAAKSAGITAPIVTGDPNADPTFSAAAAKATANGVDGVALFPSPVNVPKMIEALRQTGYQGKISLPTVILPETSIQALGSAGNGVLADSQVTLTTDTADPGVQQYLADMKKYGSNQVSDASIFAWSAVQVFAKAIAHASSFDAPGITAALNALSTPVDINTVAPWRAADVKSPLTSFQRILNPTVTFGVVQNGQLVTEGGGFVNPFTMLSGTH